MANDLLAVRNAKAHVESYAKESADQVALHEEAMDCRNCESFLQMGIDAFEWLMRADRQIRLGVFRGEVGFDQQTEDAMAKLCVLWKEPVLFAEKWIAVQQLRKCDSDNLDEFRRCVSEMDAIVDANAGSDGDLPEPIAVFRDLAIQENRDGKTAEFV